MRLSAELRGCAALLVLLAFLITPAQAQAQDLPERCREAAELAKRNVPLPYLPQDSRELVYLRVAGVRYAIPANYFRYPPIGCDTEEGVFLLRVLLPTFEGWTEENRDEIEGTAGKPSMWMNILANTLPEGGMVRVFRAHARGVDPAGDYPLWEGLLRTKNARGEEVFFSRKDEAVTFLMTCKTVAMVNYPGCQQHFPYRGAVIQLSFRRPHLDNWRTIWTRTVKLLDGFVQSASE